MKQRNYKRKEELDPMDLSYFCRQISILMDAGIAPEMGMGLMWDDRTGSGESPLLSAMEKRMQQGLPFFQALEETGRFPEYLVRMARIGEACGNLDQVMESLANYYEREAHVRKALRSALLYPALMATVMLLVMLLLTTQVMPVFQGALSQLSAQTDPLIGVVKGIGQVVSGAGLCVMVVLLTSAGAALRFGRRKGWVSRVVRRLESRGKISQLISRSRLAQALSITLRSGMNVEEGFSMAEYLVVSRQVKQRMALCQQAMSRDELFADAAGEADLFPGIQGQLLRMGQQAGRLDEMLEQIGQECAEQASDRIDGILARLEPALIVILSAAVGAMMLVVMLPLIEMLYTLG